MVDARFSRLTDLTELGGRWRALEAKADGRFFLGWTWVGAWLESYGARPELLTVSDPGGGDVALALVGHGRVRRLLGPVSTLFLNQSGDARADRAYIEYNGLLTHAGREPEAVRAAIAAIEGRRDWRALTVAGVPPGSAMVDMPARRRVRTDRSPVYQVDLNAVREAGGDYLALLSANTRSQIRRAVKEHGGALPAVMAGGADQADAWIEEIRALNAGRHADNAWDDDAFRHFVATLVRHGRDNGEVELLRFADAGGLVGLLINFVYRGEAMNYQSAFAAPRNGKDKPGLLCHAAAVAHYADRELARYSLLAGKDRYKQSLATCEEALEWWTVERFSPRLEAEALLRRMLRRPAGA